MKLQPTNYTFPPTGTSTHKPRPSSAFDTGIPGLLITHTIWTNEAKKNGDVPDFPCYSVTHRRTGKAIAQIIPSIGVATIIARVLDSIGLPWSASEDTVQEAYKKLCPEIKLWLTSIANCVYNEELDVDPNTVWLEEA
jgi:hypothetical protein